MELNLIYAGYAGSHMYGTNTPQSDIDVRGVCIEPIEAILGLSPFEQFQPSKKLALKWSQEQLDVKSDDLAIYGLRKFCNLALQCNPNIIELLFVSKENALLWTDTWDQIHRMRGSFLSKFATERFAGYAYSQLKRIQTHRRWMLEPPEEPDPYDYGLANDFDGRQYWTDMAMHSQYGNLLKEFQNYESWIKNRNPYRASLEEKYGYDTKHAAHLYRLVDECAELVTTGKITIPLHAGARQRYFDVMNGKFEYEAVVEMAETARDRLRTLAEKGELPDQPNKAWVEQLLIQIYSREFIPLRS